MPHVKVTCERGSFIVAKNAQTTRTTEGANPPLLEGGILRQVCVELVDSFNPIHVVIHLVHEATVIELKAGWARGPPDHGGAGALIWVGEQPIGHNASLFIFARNNGGFTATPIIHWSVERP